VTAVSRGPIEPDNDVARVPDAQVFRADAVSEGETTHRHMSLDRSADAMNVKQECPGPPARPAAASTRCDEGVIPGELIAGTSAPGRTSASRLARR